MARSKRGQVKEEDEYVVTGNDIDDLLEGVDDDEYKPSKKKRKQKPKKLASDVVASCKRVAPLSGGVSGTVSRQAVASVGVLPAEFNSAESIVDTSGLGPLSRFTPVDVRAELGLALENTSGIGARPARKPRGGLVRGSREEPVKPGREETGVVPAELLVDAASGSLARLFDAEIGYSLLMPGRKETGVAPAELLIDAAGGDLARLLDGEIDDSLIELLESEARDELLWDEEAECELAESEDEQVESHDDASKQKAPWIPEVWLDALLECTDASHVGPAVRQMISECVIHREASQDVLGFLEETEESTSTWPSHCRLVDEIWARYAPEFARICECDVALLSKPSGPLHATICT
jgi:hypothetical protein